MAQIVHCNSLYFYNMVARKSSYTKSVGLGTGAKSDTDYTFQIKQSSTWHHFVNTSRKRHNQYLMSSILQFLGLLLYM